MELKTDDELVVLAQQGKRLALEELFERHYTRIFGVCRRMLRHEDDACDAAQESFLAITRNLQKFSREAAFSTWAYSIAVNVCKDELKRRQRQSVLPPEAEVFETSSSRNIPGEVAEITVDVQAALAQLKEEYRTALVLREQAELSYDEIAELLEVPVGTVRSRIARGRAELVRLLELAEPEAAGAGVATSQPAAKLKGSASSSSKNKSSDKHKTSDKLDSKPSKNGRSNSQTPKTQTKPKPSNNSQTPKTQTKPKPSNNSQTPKTQTKPKPSNNKQDRDLKVMMCVFIGLLGTFSRV